MVAPDRSALARALFAPRAVALVGASADPEKNTGRPQRFLARHGYAGRIVPVNPNRAEVQGVAAVARLADTGEPVDQALIMVPADAVAGAVEDCIDAGVTVATVYSDGFAETGVDGRRAQEALVARARAGGLRLVGPNSMGVISPAADLALSVNAVLEMANLPRGRLAMVSQSGSLLGSLLSRGAARGIGFSRMVSVGNEADIGVGEVLDLLVDDDATEAVVLFLETLRDAEALAAAARRAFAAGKPVVAYKLGRSDAGQRLAQSHSGALAGEDAAAAAFLAHHGIARVDILETLLEAPPLFRPPPAAGRRVAVVTTTGGGAATVVDRLGAAGLELVRAPAALADRMTDFGLTMGSGPLVDLTMAGTREGVYAAALEVLLASDACDAVVCVVGSSGQFHPELAVEPILAARDAAKPVAAFLAPQADESLRLLAAAGIAAFRTPEACADGIRAALDRRAPVAVPQRPTADLAAAVARATGIVLDEAAGLAFMAGLGVPVAPHRLLATPDEVCDLAFPVAVKVRSPDLPHKTEAGGVVLGVVDGPAQAAAGRDILDAVADNAPGARVAGLLVQEMQAGLGEVLVGFRRDPMVGPLVVLAAGGVLAEVQGDKALRVAPVDHATAREMITEVRGLAPLRGYRGLPEGDLEALADVVVRMSDLARLASPVVAEAEVNPLIVRSRGEGVIAVDAFVAVDAGAAIAAAD